MSISEAAFSNVIEHCPVHNTLLQPPQGRIRVGLAEAAAAERKEMVPIGG